MKAFHARLLFAIVLCPAISRAELTFPHQERIATGVQAIGFADRYHSANCGWVELADSTLLVDLPRGAPAEEFVAAATKATGKPATALALTHASPDDAPTVADLVRLGVKRIYLSPSTHQTLTSSATKPLASGFIVLANRTSIGDARMPVDFLPADECCTAGAAAIHVAGAKTLFAGPLIFHGPRAPLAGTDTEAWLVALQRLAALRPAHVVAGFGSWGSAELVDRQRRFLGELRRQIGYFIAQGRPHDDLQSAIGLAADYLVWMPYDTPVAEDLEHVYQELTVPQAPFRGRPPKRDDTTPHALVLFGDLPHEPGHVEHGLRPVFEAAGVVPHFTVDVRALSAENLAHVRLLVIYRDGLMRPKPSGGEDYVWMTPDQQRAVVEFVERGGAFLNLHNSMGLYPDDGPYLNLVGGRYEGHGPLERFRVEVVDRDHPVTRGVEDFSVADEQHTPSCDEQRVHVLLRNRSDEGKTAPAGWVREPGRGRVCYLANGHTREALAHPMAQRLMRNAVAWCLRQDARPDADVPSAAKESAR